MSHTYRTEAIVLGKHKFSEADNILTLLSPTGGRIGAIAKGIRKTKSKFGGRLEPFSHVDLMLHRGRNLHTVTQAESIEPFDAIRTDYDKLTYGCAALGLLDRVAMEEHGDERLFGLALASCRALAAATGGYRRILSAFEIKLMAIIGYRPHLDACVICGAAAARAYFSNRAGGVMCEACSLTDQSAEQADAKTLAYLRGILGARMSELDGVEADDGTEEALSELLRGFLAYHVQSRLKGREFVGRMESEKSPHPR